MHKSSPRCWDVEKSGNKEGSILTEQFEAAQTFTPIRLSYGTDPRQYGELWLPEVVGPHPVIVLIHGGGWRSESDSTYMDPIAADLPRRGLAVWNLSYRRVGDPGGGWPATFADVAQGVDFLQSLASQYGLDPSKVIAMGHSSGGQLALWLGARPKFTAGSFAAANPLRVRGIISLAGIGDLALHWGYRAGSPHNSVAALLGGTPGEVPERYAATSPAQLLPLGVPQVIARGDADELGRMQADAYYARAKAAGDPVSLLELPGVDHMQIVDPDGAGWQTIMGGLYALLFAKSA